MKQKYDTERRGLDRSELQKIMRSQRKNLEKMKEVSTKTEYETGMAVCSAGDKSSRHVRNVVVGSETEVVQGDCTPGTSTEVAVHTHPEPAPPSIEDLRRVKENDATRCVMPIEPDGSAKLVCMKGDDFDPDEASRDYTEQIHYNEEDLQRMKDSGLQVEEFDI